VAGKRTDRQRLTDWVRSANFAHEVDSILAAQGLTISTHGMYAADNDRSLGQIFIQGNDPDQLKQIADAAVIVLQTRSGAYFPQLGDTPAEVTILETPMIFPIPPAIANRLRPVLQIALAVFAGIGLAFLAEYFDPFLRRREQLEGLGMSVIGSIPRE
jgi:capsular polysaccharide biosynthesis protein